MRIPATIAAVRGETPSVKSFMLDLGGRSLGFSAGQWVDFFVSIEGAEAVGGYSITSSPAVQTRITLAVKRDGGAHPVTAWLHDEARAGDRVEIALGGDFFFTPGEADSVTLIGGGIGLTPLMSVVRAADELSPSTRLTLLYSASAPSELLFRRELESIAARNPRIRCEFTITRPTAAEPWSGRAGRITAAMLRETGVETDSLCFICGPPSMIRDVAAALGEIGVPRSMIRYERWW